MNDQVCVYSGFMLKVKVETISSLSSVQWHRDLHWKLGQNCKCRRTVEDLTLFIILPHRSCIIWLNEYSNQTRRPARSLSRTCDLTPPWPSSSLHSVVGLAPLKPWLLYLIYSYWNLILCCTKKIFESFWYQDEAQKFQCSRFLCSKSS